MSFLLAAALSLAQAAPAVRWEALVENPQGAHFIDPDTISRDGARVRFGFRTILAAEMPPGLRILVARGEIDCLRLTRMVLRIEAYRADGTQVLAEDVSPADQRAEPINRDDPVDHALTARLCAGPA